LLPTPVFPAKAGTQFHPERLELMRLSAGLEALNALGSIWAPAFAGESGF